MSIKQAHKILRLEKQLVELTERIKKLEDDVVSLLLMIEVEAEEEAPKPRRGRPRKNNVEMISA